MRQGAIAMGLAFFLSGTSATAGAQTEPRLLEQGCDAGDLDACIQLGERRWFGMLGLKKDTVRAVLLVERACDAGKPDGCYKLGEHFKYGNDAARARAVQLFQKACDSAHRDGCASLGTMYTTG